MKKLKKIIFAAMLLLAVFAIAACIPTEEPSIEITNGTKVVLKVGESVQLDVKLSAGLSKGDIEWLCPSSCIELSSGGFVTAKHAGTATVRAQIDDKFDLIVIEVKNGTSSGDGEYTTQKEIVDALFELKAGEYLGNGKFYTLTGIVNKIDKKTSNYTTLHFTVEGKSIMCYKLVGHGFDVLEVGDEIKVTGALKNYSDKYFEFDEGCILLSRNGESGGTVGGDVSDDNPYKNMSKDEFYANYSPAESLEDALYRSEMGFLSGTNSVPGQYVEDSEYRPTDGLLYIRNTTAYYTDDGMGYVVLNAYGHEVIRIFEGGAYITTEEVAAYVYAFGGTYGSIPANYSEDKNASPVSSIWGEYLRCNHSYFSGDTDKYPKEPELPNIMGCGGRLRYYEMDIGTTGTVTTPDYPPAIYNDGYSITRGAARIVYGREDLNGNGIYEQGELYVFYTANHYSDFREYLNYFGGWGEIFGYETGLLQGTSKTPYVNTAYAEFYPFENVAFIPALIPDIEKYLTINA